MSIIMGDKKENGSNQDLAQYLSQSIRHMDYQLRQRLTHMLDAEHGNNWRALRAVMEDDGLGEGDRILIDERAYQTQQLLDKLSIAGKNMMRLTYYLKKMRHYQALSLFGINFEGGSGPPRPAPEPTLPRREFVQPVGHAPLPERTRAPLQQQGAVSCSLSTPLRPRVQDINHSLSVNSYPLTNIHGDSVGPPVILTDPELCTYLMFNKPLNLEFAVRGGIDYTWFFKSSSDKTPVSIRSGDVEDGKVSLKIDHITFEKTGWYYCVVSNRHGSSKTKDSRVTIWDVGQAPEGIHIFQHPDSQWKAVGSSCRLECHAVLRKQPARDEVTLNYQWIQYPENYGAGEIIKGATNSVLIIENVQREHFGKYICLVSHEGEDPKFSVAAEINPCRKSEIPYIERKFTAVDKIALLLGVSRNKGPDGRLPAIEPDLITLSSSLSSMGFKVISAINLEKKEMRGVLKKFYSLVKKGMYAVVYVAGHGFEKNGKPYVKCYDSVANESSGAVCLEEIKVQLQRTEAALIMLIVDVCRVDDPGNDEDKLQTRYIPTSDYNPKSNLLVFYATSTGMKAYEQGQSSIFVDCLKDFIRTKEPVQTLCQLVLKQFKARIAKMKEDENAAGSAASHPFLVTQLPMYEVNADELRSLADEIERGNTYVKNDVMQKWQEIAGKTQVSELGSVYKCEDSLFCIQLYCQSPISNVLDIIVETRNVSEWVGFVEVEFQCHRFEEVLNTPCTWTVSGNNFVFKYRIESLQRITSDIMVHPILRKLGDMSGLDDLQKAERLSMSEHADELLTIAEPLNFGKPLFVGQAFDNEFEEFH